MNDESGESMELMEEVPLIRLGECVVDGEKPDVDSRDEGKHSGRNGLLYVENMMYRVVKKVIY